MRMPRCPHCGKLCVYPPAQQQVPRLYTPTMDGFERFMREMVHVHAGTTAEAQQRTGSTQQRRKNT